MTSEGPSNKNVKKKLDITDDMTEKEFDAYLESEYGPIEKVENISYDFTDDMTDEQFNSYLDNLYGSNKNNTKFLNIFSLFGDRNVKRKNKSFSNNFQKTLDFK